MSTIKTRPNDASVIDFLNKVENEQKRADSFAVLEIMREITGAEPVMWGDSIVGFGDYSYTNTTGKENKWFLTGFSPRKQSLTLYIMSGFTAYDAMLDDLGKHKLGKSCLYIKRLSDIDEEVLRGLIKASVDHMSGGGEADYR